MAYPKFKLCAVSVALALSAGAVHADTRFSGAVAGGYEYDSNVSVDEVDATSSRGDSGWVASVDLALQRNLGEKTKGSLSYSYSRIDYQDFSQLSRETHMLGANLSTDWGPATTGINYFYIQALLDGQDFLTYQRVSPSVSGFVSKRLFLRGAYVHGEKTIARRPGRNAINDGGELDAYFFLQGLRRYVNVGYNMRREESRADRFDYRAHQVKLRLVQRFDWFERLATLELGARYEVRDYSSETPSIGVERDDDRLRTKVELAIPLTTQLQWQIYAGYSDYQSNLPAADYEQTLVGTRLEWGF